MSIGLSRFGVSLNGVPGANNILEEGDKTVLGGKEHAIISTDSMAAYVGHIGMGSQENNFTEGNGPAQRYWLLYRATLEDPEKSAFK